MFGLTFEKLLVIGLIAVFLLGPDRLPHYAAQFARLVRRLRDFADGARDRLREEMGPDFDDVDWRKLDPRQYDPRRIIREALLDDAEPARPAIRAPRASAESSAATGHAPSERTPSQRPPSRRAPDVAAGEDAVAAGPRATPFDAEAT